MRFTEALVLMRKNPLEVYHRRDSDEQWRWCPSEAGSPRGCLESRFDDGKWDDEVCIDYRDLDSDTWQLYAGEDEPWVSPKNNSVEIHAVCMEERLTSLEKLVKELDAILARQITARQDINKEIRELKEKVAKQEELIGDTVTVLEKHQDQFDDMGKKISNLEAYHPIITSNLLRLSLRLDKVEDSKYE